MKKLSLFIFFALLTAISCRFFLHQGVPVTHDGNNHLVRFANYKIAMRELQIPPRLAPNLVNKYGYPVFNYNYPLANILSLPFSILNLHYELAYKIILSTFVFLAYVGANLFLKSKRFGSTARFFALLVFALNPYILTSIIFRGNIGEIMSFGILPWIFYFLEKIKNNKNLIEKNSLLLTLSLTALLLSHNITAFFACILLGFYLVFNYWKNYLAWRKFLLSFAWAFAMALWFWLPAIMEKNLITLDGVDLTLHYYRHFPSLSQLLSIPIYFGYSYWGSVDSMSLGLGGLQLLLTFLALIYFLKRKTKKSLVFFIALFVLFLGQLPLARPLYDLIPFADFIQFPWRLALLFAIALLPVSALIFEGTRKSLRIVFFLLVFLQLIQFLKIKPIDYRHKDQIDYDADEGTTSVIQENMPKSFTYPYFEGKLEPIFILDGAGQVMVEDFYGSSRHYSLQLDEKSTIVESTAYFPGWETKVNGQKIIYSDDNVIKGRIAYSLDRGDYQVVTRFTQKTWPRLIGNGVSAAGLVAFVISSFYSWQKGKKSNKR